MKSYCFLLFFLLPLGVFAQKDAALKRNQYYNAGLAASISYYDKLLHAQAKENPALYKIYENQYAQQQQRVATLANEWSMGKYSGKNVNAALALVAKANVGAAVKLAESKMKPGEGYLFLSELYELSGDDDKAEKLLSGNEGNLEQGLQHSRLLALTGKPEQALAQTDQLLSRFAADTISLVRIKVQRCFIDTMTKNYPGAAATLIEAQYLLDKVVQDSMQQYWSAVVLGQLAQLQNGSGNIDNAYRNAQSSVAIADRIADLPLQAWAHHIMGRIYKKAGANQQADTNFLESVKAYTKLAGTYPQQYQPILAQVMNEYVEVLRWFDRKEESMEMLRKVATLRKQLAVSNYPFFTLHYARSLGRIADQYVFAYSRIDSAESVCKLQEEVLASLYGTYPLLAGADYSTVLAGLADINMTLKRYPAGIHYLKPALEAREQLYLAFPEENKHDLMTLLFKDGAANGLYGGDTALAYRQLDRADALARELKELRTIGEIEKIKQYIKKK